MAVEHSVYVLYARRRPTRGQIARDVMLRYMQLKGDEYKHAWHLHHHLDYLDEHKHTKRTIEHLMTEFRQEYPLIYDPDCGFRSSAWCRNTG